MEEDLTFHHIYPFIVTGILASITHDDNISYPNFLVSRRSFWVSKTFGILDVIDQENVTFDSITSKIPLKTRAWFSFVNLFKFWYYEIGIFSKQESRLH